MISFLTVPSSRLVHLQPIIVRLVIFYSDVVQVVRDLVCLIGDPVTKTIAHVLESKTVTPISTRRHRSLSPGTRRFTRRSSKPCTIDSNDDSLVLSSADEGNDKASVASSQRDYSVNVVWRDQVYNAL